MTQDFAPFFHNLDGPDHGRAFRVTDAGGLNVDVAPGRYRVDVTVYNFTTVTTLAMTDAATNYVYLTAIGAIASAAGGPYPALSIPLALVVCAGGDITSITDERCLFYLDAT